MDDVGKAIVMVGQILLFILACSVSIVLYSAIKNNVDIILTRGSSLCITESLGQNCPNVAPDSIYGLPPFNNLTISFTASSTFNISFPRRTPFWRKIDTTSIIFGGNMFNLFSSS